jgi:hypothetical protein
LRHVRTWQAVALAAVVLLVVVVAALALTQPRSDQAAASPAVAPTTSAPTSTPTPTVAATTQPPATVTSGPQQTAEQLADALATTLQASDFTALEGLISPSGFDWAKSGNGGLATKTPREAVAFLRAESGGRLNISVAARPLATSPVPWGTKSIDSTWRNFGNVPEQAIALVLRQVGNRWYWAGGYITR